MKVYVILELCSSDEEFSVQINTVHLDKDRAEQTCRELNADLKNDQTFETRGIWYEVEPWEVIE